MKKIFFSCLSLLFSLNAFCQTDTNADLIKLGRAYKDYMFRVQPDKKYLKKFVADYPENLRQEAEFIRQSISSDNQLLTDEFLTVPNQTVLKNIFIVREVNLLLREETEITPNELVDSLQRADIPRYELVDNYYGILFTSIGNKNQPFDLRKTDFKIDDYKLEDETEKGILFLRCMSLCGDTIWGFMNIVKPPNTNKAMSSIKKFPKINGRPYFQYSDLYFKDFEKEINKDEGKESYKAYYIDKYYETLLSHLICLKEQGADDEKIRDLLLGSVLKDSKLYKYTKHKELLEGIFQKAEKN